MFILISTLFGYVTRAQIEIEVTLSTCIGGIPFCDLFSNDGDYDDDDDDDDATTTPLPMKRMIMTLTPTPTKHKSRGEE